MTDTYFSVYADISPIEMKFTIASHHQSKIDTKIEKKLANLGMPSIWLIYSDDKDLKIKSVGDGIIEYKGGSFGDTFPISEGTVGSTFQCLYDNDKKILKISMGGKFLVWNSCDGDQLEIMKKIKYGYLRTIGLKSKDNKDIKLPKNEFGITDRLTASIFDHGDDFYYEIGVRISAEKC